MSLLLSQFSVPEPNYPSFTPAVDFGSVNLFILIDALVLVILLVALFFLIKVLFRSRSFLPTAFQKVILSVAVPKEGSDTNEQEESLEQIRNQISLAESWFATLGGLRAQRGPKSWLFGRTDSFSLEIICRNGLISFYVGVPRFMRDYMEQQILAQYPEANLTEVEDYNIFSPTGTVLAGYLRFTRSYIFPIKTYRTLNSDPLNALTNSLSKVLKTDGIAIQIIARSAKKSWHAKGSKVAREIQKGKTVNEAIAATGGFSLVKMINFFNTKTPEQVQKEQMKQPRALSPMEQELVKGLEEKTSRAGLDCNVRVVVSAENKAAALAYLNSVLDSFSQFNFYQYGNSFKLVKESANRLANDFIYRNYKKYQRVLLNTEELASIYHLPTPFLETPNIKWLLAKKSAPPTNLPQEGLLLGENIYRGVKSNVYLQTDDRRRHAYIIGMTGTGKSVLMSNLAIQDIRNGKGVCVIDPHGSLIESILPNIPKERIDEVVYFNPSDTERPIGLNMLEAKTPELQDFAIQEMISIFYKLVTDPSMIGPLFEHNMRNAMLTLMADVEHPGTIVEIPRIFSDKDFQKYKLGKVTDPMVRSFWEQEMAKTSDF
ncbi:MAG: DUF87 domain-containing protein, partial [Candidatus Paceibacterota bacterium]